MPCYRVPKRRVRVRIALRDQPLRSASIFVGDLAASHKGPERPSDLMNADAAFFAVESQGEVEFLPRHAVAFLAVPKPLEIDGEVGSDETVVELAVVLDDGRRLDGTVRYHLPDAARRLQDVLNLPDRFLRLEGGGEVLLVNKGRIASARERRPGEEPRAAD